MVQSKDAKQWLGAVWMLNKQARISKGLVFDAVRVMVYTSKGLVFGLVLS